MPAGALLLSANEVVSSDRLVDQLWGEHPPESGRTALQVRVSQLRKALRSAGARLATRDPGYVLRVDREELDVYRFERLVKDADAAEPAIAAVKLREALALWRGPPLADVAYESFAQAAIGWLEELRLAAVEKRIEADLALGREAKLIGELEVLVADHPLRERLHAQLMLALYRCGRQAEALEAYQRAREQLSGELGLEPGPELKGLQTAILNHDASLEGRRPITYSAPAPAVGAAACSAESEVPRRTVPLIGRDRELEETLRLLADPDVALLTVTGTGGTGKTALALEAARQAGGLFADGVTVVWLASLAHDRQVVPGLARVLGVELASSEHGIETIARAVRDQHRLLVFDNFEHVLAAAPAVAQLVARCSQLKVLVTSRAPLRVALESVYPLRGLALPDEGGEISGRELSRYPSGALFVERASAVDPSFQLTDANAPAITELCRYLAGLPLAIELAAARVAVSDPSAILERLRNSREPLGPARRDAPERQRTMDATIDWSYQLLDATTRTLFARLSVFVGGFTAEGAEAISGELHEGVVDELALLHDHGLIHRVSGPGGTRLSMLEPIRDYARRRRRADPCAEETTLRYGEYYAQFAENAAAGLRSHMQLAWLDRLDDEQADLRALLHGLASQPHLDTALRIAGALTDYWYIRDLIAEIRDWLTQALDRPRGDPVVRARALLTLGVATGNLEGDWQNSTRALEECLTLCDVHSQPELRIRCEAHLAIRELIQGKTAHAAARSARVMRLAAEIENPRARAYVISLCAMSTQNWEEQRQRFQAAVALLNSVEDRIWPTLVNMSFGYDAILAGDFSQARSSLEQASAGADAVWGAGPQAVIQGNLGLLDLLEDRDAEAAQRLSAVISVLRRTGDQVSTREFLFALAALAAKHGHVERASRFAATAVRLCRAPRSPTEQLLHQRYLHDLPFDETRSTLAGSPWPISHELDAILADASRADPPVPR